jgi:xanthine/CO dehydrogenase XdhC/CoxF family maturation factor
VPSVEEALAERLARGEEVVLVTVIRVDGEPPSRPGAKLLMSRTSALAGTLGCSEFDSAALADAPTVAAGGTPQLRTYRHDLGSIEAYLEPHAPVATLVVFGATPVAGSILRWAPELGFRPVFVETRPERLQGNQWPTAITSLEELGRIGGSDLYAVHTDHDAPDIVAALLALVPLRPKFIGLVGSRRHTGHHLEGLRAKGVGEDVIAQIQTPAGLDLGGVTAAEIALAILAGVVARRHGHGGGWLERAKGESPA